VFFELTVVTTVNAFSPIGRKVAEGLPLMWLVGFQAFCLPTELLIYQAAEAGLAPMEMTFHGRNFDILTAILALVLLVLMRRGKVTNGLEHTRLGIADDRGYHRHYGHASSHAGLVYQPTQCLDHLFPVRPVNRCGGVFGLAWTLAGFSRVV